MVLIQILAWPLPTLGRFLDLSLSHSFLHWEMGHNSTLFTGLEKAYGMGLV